VPGQQNAELSKQKVAQQPKLKTYAMTLASDLT